MEFTCLQENLKQGLFIVNHIAGKNNNLPILSNVKIEIKEGVVKLITTNLEIGVTNIIRGKISKEGSFTVDSKILSDFINLLPNKKTKIVLESSSVKIECENYKTKIKGLSDEDFPLIPEINRENVVSVDINEFKKALSQVVFAVMNSETRMELSGVFFNVEQDNLILAATDSYRLAEKTIKIQNKKQINQKTIIPARTIQEIIRIMSGEKESENKEIEVVIADTQILFKINDTEVISRLIEGQYPDYKQIIPKNVNTKCVINRNELLRAVKASSLFSKTGINDISIDFPENKNKTVISAVSGQTGENVVEIDSNIQGNDNGVTVNYQYLIDGLNSINSENIKIEIIDNNTPCIIKPENDEGYLYIIMPIKQ